MTNAEVSAAVKKHRKACPKCGSVETYVAGGVGSYHGCHSCGKKWGWSNAAGTKVSRAKYEERVEKERGVWRAKATRSWRLDAPGEETDMAKAKKVKKSARGGKATKKAAAKRTSGSSKKLTVVAYVLSMLAKNPKLTAEQFVVGVRKQFPKSIQRPAYFGGYVKTAIAKGIIKKSDRD